MIELWAHQKKAVQLAKYQSGYGLFFEMGCGKTAAAIHILLERYRSSGTILKTLILAPPIVVPNWETEFGLHSNLNSCNIVPLIGSGRKRAKTFSDRCLFGHAKIAITNYEALLMEPLFNLFLRWHPTILVLDESHRVKSIQAKRTRKAIELSKLAPQKLLLTGTPVLNSAMDLFSQFLIMDGGVTFGHNFFAFRNTYFFDLNAGMPKHKHFPNWIPKPGSEENLNKLVAQSSMRVTKKECLDLPPLVRQKVYVDMSPLQRKAYNEMKKHFITYVNDAACVGDLAITKGLRLQQIVSGYIKTEKKEVALKNTPRQAALKDLLEELTPKHKVIVWSVFKQNYRQIRTVCDDLGVTYVECHGEISPSQKQLAVERFSKVKDCRVFIGHPGSGGIGINLTSSDYAIFFSRNFSLEADLQAESRNHRGGSEIHQKVTRIDLVCKDTIDEEVLKALARKEKIGEKVLKEMAVRL